jgi:hypothetical protein
MTGIWNEVPGGARTDGALSAAADGRDLYLFFKGLNKHVYYNVMKPGENWGNWIEVPGGATTNVGLRACFYYNRIYLFLRDNKSRILYNYEEGGSWSNWKEVPIGGSTAMRLAARNFGKLWLFHTGDDDRIYMSSLEISSKNSRENWQGWYEVPGGGSTFTPLAAEYYHVPYSPDKDKLYLFYRGINALRGYSIYYSHINRDQAWSGWSELDSTPVGSPFPPETCRIWDKLYLFSSRNHADDNSRRIYYNILKCTKETNFTEKWMGWKEVPGGGVTKNLLAAGIGVPSKGNASIYLFHTGNNNCIYYQSLETQKDERLIC